MPDYPAFGTTPFFAGNGSTEYPFIIKTNSRADAYAQMGLIATSDYLDKGYYYILAEDLNYTDKTFTQIGSSSNPFDGVFDGNGHEIANVALSDQMFVGIDNGNPTIKNLKFSGCTVTYTTMINRCNLERVWFDNCTVTGTAVAFILSGNNETAKDVLFTGSTVDRSQTYSDGSFSFVTWKTLELTNIIVDSTCEAKVTIPSGDIDKIIVGTFDGDIPSSYGISYRNLVTQLSGISIPTERISNYYKRAPFVANNLVTTYPHTFDFCYRSLWDDSQTTDTGSEVIGTAKIDQSTMQTEDFWKKSSGNWDNTLPWLESDGGVWYWDATDMIPKLCVFDKENHSEYTLPIHGISKVYDSSTSQWYSGETLVYANGKWNEATAVYDNNDTSRTTKPAVLVYNGTTWQESKE